MMKPTIHLNGTSRQALYETYLDAHNALQQAIYAVERTYPNGRDYYPQGDEAIVTANNEHRARIRELNAVLHQLEALVCHTLP